MNEEHRAKALQRNDAVSFCYAGDVLIQRVITITDDGKPVVRTRYDWWVLFWRFRPWDGAK
jgi:hypothetical protein